MRYGGLPWMQAVFYGVGAAVIGIIAISAYKLTTKNIGKDKLLWAIFLVDGGVTVWTQSESVWLFLGAGVLVWLVRAPPEALVRRGRRACARRARARHGRRPASIATGLDWPLLAQIGAFFAKAGAFVFGSGLAIVPFLYGGVVHEYHWLTERQFVDAVAVAMITPGPVVITVGFIGYLVAGLPGAVVAALGHVPAVLPVHDHAGALLQEIRQAARARRVRRRRDRGGDRRDHRRRRRSRAAVHRGSTKRCDRLGDDGIDLEGEADCPSPS